MSAGDWPLALLRAQLAPLLPALVIEVAPTIDSSNTELLRRARRGALAPTVLIAEEQTAGRGRQGRSWYSAAGDVLAVSIGLPYAPRDWSGLSLAVGVALAESLQPQWPAAGSGQARIQLKWPNDLWLDDGRKLAGILIETAEMADGSGRRCVIVGMGINLQPPPAQGLRTPAACLQDVDARLDGPAALLRCALPVVRTLLGFAESGFAPFQPRFARRDYLKGRMVQLSNGVQGTACGVQDDGALQLSTAGGLQRITSSEVSVRPARSCGAGA
ncbi:biotin--[acetyl-CoA-carboxylase] ligase [Comamonas sp. NLF-1-9]|uniref:biotin--[acetyl-CoA-carboxylase] ligase n=1 Tax=Comamonas sp. NLF-1-9 TaxID=2853163 RepID=UPI001C44290F|nr:biotin--[acetyl-CoA-carboxylase] ligase [Comamonas sp. NLF-1-9]QXL83888.1 biotin--[acetyl-CoA-carboxylase] ligase [Comamonas sp. NLF-1-9]